MATPLFNHANTTYTYSGGTAQSTQSNTTVTLLTEAYVLMAKKESLQHTFRPGDSITYTASIKNCGSSTITGVTVKDDLGHPPGYLTYLEGSARVFKCGSMTPVTPSFPSGNMTIQLPEPLAGGECALVLYVMTVSCCIPPDVHTIMNTAEVRGMGGGSCIFAEETRETIHAEEYANLCIFKIASDDMVAPGDSLTYTLLLVNTGNLPATDVAIVDELPDEMNTITAVYLNGSNTPLDPSKYEYTGGVFKLPRPGETLYEIPAATGMGPGVMTVVIVGTIA